MATPSTTRETQTSKQTVRKVGTNALAWVWDDKFAFDFLAAYGLAIFRVEKYSKVVEIKFRHLGNAQADSFTVELNESERQELFDFYKEHVLPLLDSVYGGASKQLKPATQTGAKAI